MGEKQRHHTFCDETMKLVNLYFTEKDSFVEGSLVMGILRRSLLGNFMGG